jgi:alkanesulfonate monooxygenase SsuD/methylene tetrahydromethanopterin reductase-like flavin-dependent oxidoreductase (luciferase family)
LRIGAVLSPEAEWAAVAGAAEAADRRGLDSIGLWDHYHALAPDLGYVAGWAAFGALASKTGSVKVVPMVINVLHYELGVLAKETSVLSHISGGRFELGIGAGDWPASFVAWGKPFPAAADRAAILGDVVNGLRMLWSGEPVSVTTQRMKLVDAICAPPPLETPRIVVGCGPSRSLVRLAAGWADEINVYDDDSLIALAREEAEASDRAIGVSVTLGWEWDKWPADPEPHIRRLADAGIDRVFISMMGEDNDSRIAALADLQPSPASAPTR